jgi:hypothetical protein
MSTFLLSSASLVGVCDEIFGKSTIGGGDPTDRARDGGIGRRKGDVAFLHQLIDRHHQQPLLSTWPRT